MVLSANRLEANQNSTSITQHNISMDSKRSYNKYSQNVSGRGAQIENNDNYLYEDTDAYTNQNLN